MSDLTPEEFDEKADEIFKRLSRKRMAEIKKTEMKYEKVFKKFDKYYDDYLEDELNQIEKRIKQEYEINKIKQSNKLRYKSRF